MELDFAISTFFEESSENLEMMEKALLSLESDAANDISENLNALFRAVHTIKGSSGMFGFDSVVAFTHVLENLLQTLREGKKSVSPELITVLFESRDHMEALLNHCQQNDCETPEELTAETRRLLANLDAAGDTETTVEAGSADAESAPVGNPNWQLSLRFDPDSFRDGMDPLPILNYLASLGEISSVEVVESLLPEIEDCDLEHCYLGFEISLNSHASEQEIINTFAHLDESTYRILPPMASLSRYAQTLSEREAEADLLDIWVKQGALTDEEAAIIALKPESLFQTTGGVAGNETSAGRAPTQPPSKMKSSSLRVDSDKLDELINLIGELVTSGAGVALLSHGNGPAQEAVANLNGLVEEVRDAALKLRMVQVAGTFNRFNRLVRDTATSMGKNVELIMSGEETELDKSVIEHINDPLTHLVRNAIDHGIEAPEDRRAQGKPETGILRLSAYHEAGSIVLEIKDDGKGLDPEFIRKRAIERGLVSPDQVMSRDEIFQLIFEPGFSTKEVVTDLSGRGVGMDVVRRNINDLRGRIEVESEVGQGSTFRIYMPLTLAIIDGFLIGVGDERFVLPLESVEECVALDEASVKSNKNGAYINLREQVLPLVDLKQSFDIQGVDSRRKSVVVIQNAGCRVGVIVDKLLGELQTVIKPLGPVFKRLSGVTGSTIMADGEVALILDIEALASPDNL